MTRFQAIERKIKNGKIVIIREAIEVDADEICKCINIFIQNNEGMVWEQGEFSPTVEQQRATINNFNESSNEILLIAEYEGKILGTIDFRVGKRRRVEHAGEFGMSIMPNWRGLGLGFILLEALIGWARSNSGIEKMALRVIDSNVRAIELYKKFGFLQEGRCVRGLKYSNGTYADFIFMGLDVRT